jgi:hypothetical protein
MAEFTKDRYGVDVMKVEVPINMKFVEGAKAFGGQESAYTKQEAMDFFRRSADVATKPFIYLSAGVSNAEFTESLELAARRARGSRRAVRPRHLEGRHPCLRQAGGRGLPRVARGPGRANIRTSTTG